MKRRLLVAATCVLARLVSAWDRADQKLASTYASNPDPTKDSTR